MPAALPWITAGTMVYNAVKQPPMPPQPKTLSMDAARGQAQQMLNPLFDEQLKEALNRVDQNNIQRGFFGQMPGAALSRSTAADIESRRAQATGQLGAQLQGMSWDQAMQHAQLAYNAQQAQQANLMSSLGFVQDRMTNVWDKVFGPPKVKPEDVTTTTIDYLGSPAKQTYQLSPGTITPNNAGLGGGYIGGLNTGMNQYRLQQPTVGMRSGWVNPYA